MIREEKKEEDSDYEDQYKVRRNNPFLHEDDELMNEFILNPKNRNRNQDSNGILSPELKNYIEKVIEEQAVDF